MATTNLIVDFLVIGVVALSWLLPLLIAEFGITWINEIKKWGTLAFPVMLGFLYILGITISRLADEFTDPWDSKLKKKIFGEKSYHDSVNYIIAKSHSANEYIGYRRSIIRTARACALNFLLAAFAWSYLYLFSDYIKISKDIWLANTIVSILISMILIRVWYHVLKGYFSLIDNMKKHL